jgi:hypothetical protein
MRSKTTEELLDALHKVVLRLRTDNRDELYAIELDLRAALALRTAQGQAKPIRRIIALWGSDFTVDVGKRITSKDIVERIEKIYKPGQMAEVIWYVAYAGTKLLGEFNGVLVQAVIYDDGSEEV